MDDRTQTITNPSTDASGSARPQPTLRLLYSGKEGIVMPPRRVLAPGQLAIGREMPESEFASLSEDPSVSRRHAVLEISPDGDAASLADSGSHNGTFVNGRRIAASALADGDVIRVGNSILIFRYEPAPLGDAGVEGLVGRSPAIRSVRALLALVANSPATVLLLGESGVGKGVAAEAVHAQSGRTGPFVSVNCATIPEALAESQLFGHVAGAFTGARHDHLGFFRSAEGGTLFLDEIAELPAPVQAKLLGVLEDRRVTPVGSVKPIPCDVRLVAATNADLSEGVARSAFRGDLYARLTEFAVVLPPLRARREDVLPILLSSFADAAPRLSPKLAEAFVLYDWPYNVRELLKVTMELRIRGQGRDRLELELIAERLGRSRKHSPVPPPAGGAPSPSVRAPIPTREELERLVREKKGIISDIALATGRSRKQIYRWLELHGLDAERFRDKR